MYKIMSVWDMQKEFNTCGRENYFSDEGLEAIDNYYIDCYSGGGEVGTEVEFDVVAICCDWNEYGDGVILGFDDFISDYDYLLDDNEIATAEDDKEILIDAICQQLEEKTTVERLENGDVLLLAF